MQESADSMTAGLMAGANYVLHAAGWLEGGLVMGYEKFVMDLDRCAMMHRTLAGLTIEGIGGALRVHAGRVVITRVTLRRS